MITLEKAYQILNVSPDASDEEIRKAYRMQAKEIHPDTHPDDPYAETKFQLLQEAKAKIEEERNMAPDNEFANNSSNATNQGHSSQTSGSNFASDRSSVLKRLNEVYSFVKKRKYRKIEESTDCRELAYKCAYGTLLRHALECIVHDKAREIHVITEGRSSDELLSFIIDNYPFDVNTKKIFYDAKFITNKLTHIEHFSYSQITFESCQEFYNKRFKKIIEAHLSSNKKRTQSYLRKIYEQLEDFDVKSRITSTLLLGSVMRQLLECIVDLWLYNESLVCEGKANIKDKLDVLRFYLQNVGPKQTYYTYSTLDNLHAIRIAVNQAMHVSPDNKMNISKIRSGLMAQIRTLDFEINMPTGEQKSKKTKSNSFGKALLWIFFLPIMLCVTIGKSKIGVLGKIILIYLCLQMTLGATIGIIGAIYDSFDNGGVFDRPTIIEEKYQLEENDSGYTIHVLPEKASTLNGIVEIPSEYEGTPITAIASKGFAGCSNVTSFIVPKSVTYIGEGAFEGCNNLQYITLPFVGQTKDATDEKAVLGYIFGYEQITKEMDSYPSKDTVYNDRPIDVVGQTWQFTRQEAYDRTRQYFYYFIPNSLTTVTITMQNVIPDYAFNNCTNITDVNYLNSFQSVTKVGTAAFQGCSNLNFEGVDYGKLEFGNSIATVGDYAFNGCIKITSIIIPNSVRTIGVAAFKGCNNLQSITLPFVGCSEDAVNENAVLGYIFGYEEVTKEMDSYPSKDTLYNDKPVDIVGQTWQFTYQEAYDRTRHYFYYYIPDSLTTVTITKQTTVPAYAFNNCDNITSINYPSSFPSLTEIGTAAFQGCSNLNFDGENHGILEFGNSITSIGDYAFNGCVKIASITIPNTVRTIGFATFKDCNNLQNIVLPFVGASEDATNENAVLGYVFGYEETTKEMDSYPSKDTVYNDRPIDVVGQTWQFTRQEAYDRTRQYFYYYIPSSLTSVTITKQSTIPAYAFNGCSNLTSITVPAGSTYGEAAFQNCNATVSNP